MPQLHLYLDEKENKILEKKCREWEVSKADAIKRLIRDSKA